MKRKLSGKVGERINKFDEYDNPTVMMFNIIFSECPLQGYDANAIVNIGRPLEGNRRAILVGEKEISHKMYSDLLYGKEREDEEEKELIEVNGVLL